MINTVDDDSLNEVIDVLNDACGPTDEDINLEELNLLLMEILITYSMKLIKNCIRDTKKFML